MLKRYFTPDAELEEYLKKTGKENALDSLRYIWKKVKTFRFIPQSPRLPYGNASPILAAKTFLGKKPFVFMFGDDLVKAKIPATKQLLNFWARHRQAIILGVAEVPKSQVSRYGILKLKKGTFEVEDLVEKPSPEKAPSRLASLGRFILNRDIIDILLEQKEHVTQGKEFYLTEAISAYLKTNKVLAFKIQGKWLTTGDPLSWIKATVEFALGRKDLAPDFRPYLKSLKI